MDYKVIFEDVRESDKVAIILSQYEHDNGLNDLIRYTVTKYINNDIFIQNCKDICYNEQAKKNLYGLQQNFKTFTVGNDFGEKGQLIQKHLNQAVSKTLKYNNITVYPDASVKNEDFYRVTQDKNYWSDAEAIEGDFASITRVLLATRKIKKKYNIFLDLTVWEKDYVDHLKEIVRYWAFRTVDEIDDDTIMITDRVIDREFIRDFKTTKKPIILSLANFSTNYTGKDYILELCKRKIHVIPSYFVNIGSNIIAEGLAMGTRNVKDSFQLMQIIEEKTEKFWNDADNHRLNFYQVCKQIVDYYFFGTSCSFKSVPVGVGAMTLKV